MMGRLPGTAVAVGRDSVPGRALVAIVQRVRDTADLVGCGHDAPVWVICAQHPEHGPLCGACEARHVAGHTFADERRCDGCGDPAEPIHGAGIPLAGGVWIGSIGWCDPCLVALHGLPGGRG